MTQVTPIPLAASYVAAFVPDETGEDAVALGRFLVTGTDISLTVCTVVPHTATGGDAAYGALGYASVVADRLQPIFEAMMNDLAPLDVSHTVRLSPSVGVGLLDYASEVGASMLILGSARTGVSGRYAVGSVGGLLQHASPIPLAFAPQGFAQSATESVQRIVCGYSQSPDSPQALSAAIELCRTHGVPLQLVTFVFSEYPLLRHIPGQGPARFDTTAQSAAARTQLEAVAAAVPEDIEVEIFVRVGGNIAQAVARAEWHDGDLLVLGSAPMGPFARVFLGSTALKLVRCCPVPVIAVPRPATSEAATGSDRADIQIPENK
ncbi:universal stress protein [Dermatophilaceae bacterium Sec6.4]